MVCESAEELHARLVLRAVWPPREEEEGVEAEQADEGEDAAPSLYRRLREELDEVLQSSFKKRRARIDKKVAILCQNSENGSENGNLPAPRARAEASTGVQTEEDPINTEKLAQAVKTALKGAVAASQKPSKAFGPTDLQTSQPDPKDEKEDIPVSETHSMKGTLESLGKSLSSRERQINALQNQLRRCQDMYEERTREADGGEQSLHQLLDDPSRLQQAHQERIQRRNGRVEELSSGLRRAKEQAKYYASLVQQQRAFFLQGERISACGGSEALAKHPAGEIALVPRPPAMSDEKPEVWDVGTAIANPYIVDSWPFEPNVLANRSPKEAAMQPCSEETEEDLEEERRRLPFRHGLQLRLPGRDDDDDYDDRYPGQTSTSRSA
mmetsp:Transcript_13076/g.30662  ORF Transcript_13076/g.30662 Transcript_13076/m.30662 type:complete len:383 (+) Transcript_13076:82-1230(+)